MNKILPANKFMFEPNLSEIWNLFFFFPHLICTLPPFSHYVLNYPRQYDWLSNILEESITLSYVLDNEYVSKSEFPLCQNCS